MGRPPPAGGGPRTAAAVGGAGEIARPAWGVFCRPELVGTMAVRAVCVPGQLTCGPGAEALGLDLLFPAIRCHVRTPANPRAHVGATIHPWGLAGTGRVASVAAVLHDCAVCLPTPEAVVVLDSALRRGRVTPADWGDVIGAGPHAGRVAKVLALADPQAQSVLESLARVLLVLAGIGDSDQPAVRRRRRMGGPGRRRLAGHRARRVGVPPREVPGGPSSRRRAHPPRLRRAAVHPCRPHPSGALVCGGGPRGARPGRPPFSAARSIPA